MCRALECQNRLWRQRLRAKRGHQRVNEDLLGPKGQKGKDWAWGTTRSLWKEGCPRFLKGPFLGGQRRGAWDRTPELWVAREGNLGPASSTRRACAGARKVARAPTCSVHLPPRSPRLVAACCAGPSVGVPLPPSPPHPRPPRPGPPRAQHSAARRGALGAGLGLGGASAQARGSRLRPRLRPLLDVSSRSREEGFFFFLFFFFLCCQRPRVPASPRTLKGAGAMIKETKGAVQGLGTEAI